jgi:ESCRT-I complex subunit TSG101
VSHPLTDKLPIFIDAIKLAYDDGRAELLICLHGLLPISFRGASYNIPVAVWIPHEYPKSIPLVYVVPTSDMLVRASKSIDPSGKCSFPYMEGWEHKNEVIVVS